MCFSCATSPYRSIKVIVGPRPYIYSNLVFLNLRCECHICVRRLSFDTQQFHRLTRVQNYVQKHDTLWEELFTAMHHFLQEISSYKKKVPSRGQYEPLPRANPTAGRWFRVSLNLVHGRKQSISAEKSLIKQFILKVSYRV